MIEMAYVFTASKPSSIRIACKARFLSTKIDTLITASSNLIHVYHPGSLSPSHEIVCYGRITTITPFRSYDRALDHLFVTTEDQKYFTLSYTDGVISTGVTGDLTTKGLATPDMGHRVLVDNRFIILYLYNGIISAIPIHQGSNPKKRAADGNRLLGPPQQVRLNELKIHDIALLKTSTDEQTVFGVLYRDVNLVTHLKSYELSTRKNEIELRDSLPSLRDLDHGTTLILPRGLQGVVCVAESNMYTGSSSSDQMEYAISIPTLFNCRAQVSDDLWILGDDYGLLYSLSFDAEKPVLQQMAPPELNDTSSKPISIPHVLVSLDKSLFLGSHYGDSQILSMPKLEVIAEKTNIGPIQDIIVQSSENSGGSSGLITASGAYKDGALKLIKYGVGMAEKAELEMSNVRDIWGIDELAIIVIGFIDSYVVLQVSVEGEIEQIDSGDDEIIYACAIAQKLVLVLRNELRVCSDGVTLQSRPVQALTAAKHHGNQMYILSEGVLEIWTISIEDISRSGIKKFEAEISAFEVVEFGVVVGFWSSDKLWLGDLNLATILEEKLDDGLIPHSIVLQRLSTMEQASLLIGTTDGSLVSFNYDTEQRSLSNRKYSALGSSPVLLHSFSTRQGPNVFAVTDRPAIIHASRAKIAISSINIPSCTYFTSFNNPALQSCMIVATEAGLKIGDIDDIQKLQIKSVPLAELPRRLVSASGILGALTMRMEVEQNTGNESQKSFLKIFDRLTLDQLDEYELHENEMCQSLCRLEVDGQERLAVGTSFAEDAADECTRGRILIFGINEGVNTLWVESQIEVPGSVYALAAVGSRLVAGINSFVRLYELSTDSIKEVSKFRSSTFALAIAVQESTILVGDLMKSVTYLKVENGELAEIARDYVPAWMTSVSFADSQSYLGAEAEGNLILFQESDSPLEENKMRLERIGEYRYGEMINKLTPGFLVSPDDTSIVRPHTLFGTVDGSIGAIGSISPDYVNLLIQLQTNMSDIRPSVGGLKHAEFRAYKGNNTRNTMPYRFVDGDLIEEFLEFSTEQQAKACVGLDRTVEEVEKVVETLSRLR